MLLLAALVVLEGCAVARLSVDVDVYAEDPMIDSMTDPEHISRIGQAIRISESLAVEYAEVRTAQAESYLDLYGKLVAVTNTLGNSGDPEEAVSNVREALPALNAEIDRRLSIVQERARATRDSFDGYVIVADRHRAGERVSPSTFFGAYEELSVNLEALDLAFTQLTATSYGLPADALLKRMADTVPIQYMQWIENASEEQLEKKATVDAVKAFENALETLQAESLEITHVRERISKNIGESLTQISKGRESTNPALIGEGITRAMQAASDLAIAPGLGEQGKHALGRAASDYAFQITQIDRLQDPADPAWRILSAEENQDRWQEFYSATEYMAKGNSEVVMVRDRIGHFRVQRGKNNPAALIQGQFEISRTLTAGAVNILAATTGISGVAGVAGGKPRIAEDPPAGTGQPPPPGSPQSGDPADAIQQQILDSEKLKTTVARRDELLRRLKKIRSELDATTTGQAVPEETYQRLRSLLQAYELLLKP